MKIILVLGKMLRANGVPSDELRTQMQKGVELLEKLPSSKLVISGGSTRPEYESEAKVASWLVPPKYQDRVILEEQSLSTAQNVKFVREKLREVNIESIVVVSSSAHNKRSLFLFKKYWPEIIPMLTFENAWRSTFLESALHAVIHVMTIIDKNEHVFLRIKRLFLER